MIGGAGAKVGGDGSRACGAGHRSQDRPGRERGLGAQGRLVAEAAAQWALSLGWVHRNVTGRHSGCRGVPECPVLGQPRSLGHLTLCSVCEVHVGTCVHLACRRWSGGIPARPPGGLCFPVGRRLRPIGRKQPVSDREAVPNACHGAGRPTAQVFYRVGLAANTSHTDLSSSPRRPGKSSERHPTKGSIP